MVVKSFPRKQVWSKIRYGCKLISSKTDLQEKVFEKKYLVENFLFLQNDFLENRFTRKKNSETFFEKNILVENIILLQNYFLKTDVDHSI